MQATIEYLSALSMEQLDAVINGIMASSFSELSNFSLGDGEVDPQTLLHWETLLQQSNEERRIKNREYARARLRRRQLWQRQDKRIILNSKKQIQRKEALENQKPPNLYQRMAAFIRSKVEEEKPELPKGMYSVQNVQKERQQRSKPLKQSYVIRSKKPTDPHRNT